MKSGASGESTTPAGPCAAMARSWARLFSGSAAMAASAPSRSACQAAARSASGAVRRAISSVRRSRPDPDCLPPAGGVWELKVDAIAAKWLQL